MKVFNGWFSTKDSFDSDLIFKYMVNSKVSQGLLRYKHVVEEWAGYKALDQEGIGK